MNAKWISFIAFLTLVLFYFSCQNEESLIGNSFLTDGEYTVERYPEDIVFFTESMIDEDGVFASSTTSLLGSYLDPLFGQVDASFSFQIKLPANNMAFNAVSIEDIYLNLPNIGFYGNNELNKDDVEFNIIVSKLNENIADAEDNSNETNFSSTQIISAYKSVGDISESNSLVLSLTESGFGLEEILNLTEVNLENNENFVDAFNGFKLEVEPINSIDGGIMYFNTTSDSAFLHVEYINSNKEIDTINFQIADQARLNYFEHDYTNSSFLNQDTLCFAQSMGGVFSEIEINNLDLFTDSTYIAVNNAELTVAVSENNGPFPLPEKLRLIKIDNSGAEDLTNIFIGNLDTLNNHYNFNITDCIEEVITNGLYPKFKLETYDPSSTADRVVLDNSSENPIRLDLILIKQEN